MSSNIRKIQRHGKEKYTYITIPRTIQRLMQYKQGEPIKFSIEGNKLILERV